MHSKLKLLKKKIYYLFIFKMVLDREIKNKRVLDREIKTKRVLDREIKTK